MKLKVLDHPLASHFLSCLRDRSTAPAEFRTLTDRLTSLLVLEATRDLGIKKKTIHTPMMKGSFPVLNESITAVPILRAGLGMLQSVTSLLPGVHVGYMGLERNEKTAIASSYYMKLPELKGSTVLLLDPMLATGGSALMTINLLKRHKPLKIKFLSIISAPEGLAKLKKSAGALEVYTAAIDRKLNSQKYIIPGLGDFGDRLYGTF